MTRQRVLVLSQQDLNGLLPPLQVIDAISAAACAQNASGDVLRQAKTHLEWATNSLLVMPAAVPGSLGLNAACLVTGNACRGLPATNGVMILNDGETGLPIALMNSTALTAHRTGAVGAIGVKHLTPATTSSVGIIGCGVQGTWLTVYACAVRPIREVFVVSRSMQRLAHFTAAVKHNAPHVRVTACPGPRELLELTDLVFTATPSAVPVLPDEPKAIANKHFIAAGSYRPTMQELPESVFRLARSLAVDTTDACYEVGDVINPLRSSILQQTDIFPIAECLTGKRAVDVDRTTVFKIAGAAIFDLFLAQAFLRAATAAGVGSQVPF